MCLECFARVSIGNAVPPWARRLEEDGHPLGPGSISPALGECQAPLDYSRLQTGQLSQWSSQDTVDTLAPRHSDGGR